MNSCPCCSTPMFRQVHDQKVYWFCPFCYQEMPNLMEILANKVKGTRLKGRKIAFSPNPFPLNPTLTIH